MRDQRDDDSVLEAARVGAWCAVAACFATGLSLDRVLGSMGRLRAAGLLGELRKPGEAGGGGANKAGPSGRQGSSDPGQAGDVQRAAAAAEHVARVAARGPRGPTPLAPAASQRAGTEKRGGTGRIRQAGALRGNRQPQPAPEDQRLAALSPEARAALRSAPGLEAAWLARDTPGAGAAEWACVWANRGLAGKFAGRVLPALGLTGFSLEDIIHEALTGGPGTQGGDHLSGLLRAVREFDPGRGVKFSSMAWHWIRHAVLRSLADRGLLVRRPVHLADKRRKLRRAGVVGAAPVMADPVAPPPGSAPAVATSASPAKARGWSERARAARARATAEAAEAAAVPVLSLDAGSDGDGGDGSLRLYNVLAAEERDGEAAHDLAALARALGCLTPAQRAVVEARFGLGGGEPATLGEAGALVPRGRSWGRRSKRPQPQHGVSRERVRQVEQDALQALQRALGVDPGVRPAAAGWTSQRGRRDQAG